MGNTKTSTTDDAWLDGDFSAVVDFLESNEFSALDTMSDEQVLTLLVRLHKDREALLVFLKFLDRFVVWYRSRDPVSTNYQMERFVAIAPILRRDALSIVPGDGTSS